MAGKPLVIPLDVRLMGWAANGLFAVAVVMGLGAVAWWVARHPAWTLAGITVVGDVEHQSAVTLRAHLGPRLEGTFLTVDLQEVQRLFESAPWVRRALVQREFPNRLRVHIQEHVAVAWWGEAGSGRLVNRYGEVFEAHPEDAQADRWSELSGPIDRAAQVYAVYQVLAPVFERMGREIDRLELNARGSWKVVLDGGARIELGRGDADVLLSRVQPFVATLPTLALRYGQREIESADLRYPDGYALRMRGVTTLTEAPPARPAAPTTR